MRVSSTNLYRTKDAVTGLPANNTSLDNTYLQDCAVITDDINITWSESQGVQVIAILNHTASQLTVTTKLSSSTQFTDSATPDAALHNRWRRHHIVIVTDKFEADEVEITSTDDSFEVGAIYIGALADIDVLELGREDWLSSDKVTENSSGTISLSEGATYRNLSLSTMDEKIELGAECLVLPDDDADIFERALYCMCTKSDADNLLIADQADFVDHATVFEECP